MDDSKNRILITGASSGIGEATAYAYSLPRNELFLVARRKERLEQVAENCRSKGASRVFLEPHDLSVPGRGGELVRNCLQSLGGLDLLICNAGYGIYGPVQEVSPEKMARIWQVNYQSAYESIHEAIPFFLEQKRGHIVLVSSVIGKKSVPFAGVYCATKFAQVALAEAIWGELRGKGVGVSLICPGYTSTEFQQSAVKTGSLRSMRRLGGGQNPERVARAIVSAVSQRKREVHLTVSGRLFCWLARLSPGLVSHAVAWAVNREQAESRR